MKCAALLLLLALPAIAFAVDTAKHPLLELAEELAKDRDSKTRPPSGDAPLRLAEHALARGRPPPDADCAASIGARRFSDLYVDVASARDDAGDFPGAAQAYRHALACRPRSPGLLVALSSELFSARDFAGSREAANAALAISPRSIDANRRAAYLDYVAGNWPDAIAHFRYTASGETDRERASYDQLMFWLAQQRAGVQDPEFVARTPGESWPQPLLLYLRGQYTESELRTPITENPGEYREQARERGPSTNDERLCEALFYVGESYWARGEPDVARAYFAALVNIKVTYFLEHPLALAEISNLQRR